MVKLLNKFSISVIFILLFKFSFTQNKNEILWNDSVKLTMNDFKAHPQKNNISSAITNSSISLDIKLENDTAEIKIINSFNKQKSWIKKNARSNYILNHEQKHFDISEIYARKLRQTIFENKFKRETIQKTISEIVQKNYNEAKKYQIEYDKLTNHSINVEQQVIWDEKIEKELKEFSNFTSIELKIYVEN